jgi:hypothetical protein
VSVICACTPSIISLVARLVPTLFTLTTKGETSGNSSMPKRPNLSITPRPRRHSSKLGNLEDAHLWNWWNHSLGVKQKFERMI